MAIYQRDIILGNAADIPGAPELQPPAGVATGSLSPDAAFLTGVNNSNLWPNGIVPYVIDSDITGDLLAAINQAIQTYNNNTPVNWTPRTKSSRSQLH